MTLAVVDAGPLYAAADIADQDHDSCLEVLSRGDLTLVVAALAVAEATYFVGRRLGPEAEAAFWRGVEPLHIEGPAPEDVERIAQLIAEYANFPLGGTDASIVALAERLQAPVIVTLDRRHFGAVRPRHRAAFDLLP